MSEGMDYFEAAGYEPVRRLGVGSDAKVWLVRDREFGHLRALKVLNNPVDDDLTSSDSFFRECALLLRICNGGHPNIVRIGRPRVVAGRAMVEMQHVEGRTLTDYIHSDLQFVPYAEVSRFISDIGGALAFCHAEGYKCMMVPGDDRKMSREELVARYGVAHNDLHSSNVMRRSFDGSYILLDFGLAIQDGVAVRSSMRNEGHPEYRAPEKFEAKMGGRQGDIRVDVYAFGILVFEMLTGDTPFHSEPGDLETGRIYRLHKEAPVPEIEPLREAAFLRKNPGEKYVRDYPRWLENMIRKCLAKNPDARYSNMKEFMEDFEENVTLDRILADKKADALRKEIGKLVQENEALKARLEESERQVAILKTSPAKRAEKESSPEGPARKVIPAALVKSNRQPPTWLGALLGFIPAAAAGSAGAMGIHFPQVHLDVTDDPDVQDDDIFLDTAPMGPVSVASVQGDNLTFSQAFAEARHEVGPGGVFHWHGNLYSTYTSAEWGRLTSDQQSDFSARIQNVDSGSDSTVDDLSLVHTKDYVFDDAEDSIEVAPLETEAEENEAVDGGEETGGEADIPELVDYGSEPGAEDGGFYEDVPVE